MFGSFDTRWNPHLLNASNKRNDVAAAGTIAEPIIVAVRASTTPHEVATYLQQDPDVVREGFALPGERDQRHKIGQQAEHRQNCEERVHGLQPNWLRLLIIRILAAATNDSQLNRTSAKIGLTKRVFCSVFSPPTKKATRSPEEICGRLCDSA